MIVPEGLAHTIAEVLAEHAWTLTSHECICGTPVQSHSDSLVAWMRTHRAEMIAARLGIEPEPGETTFELLGRDEHGRPLDRVDFQLFRVRCLEPDPHTTEDTPA